MDEKDSQKHKKVCDTECPYADLHTLKMGFSFRLGSMKQEILDFKKGDTALLVHSLASGMAASRLGLQKNDIILNINGINMHTSLDYFAVLSRDVTGHLETIDFTVLRSSHLGYLSIPTVGLEAAACPGERVSELKLRNRILEILSVMAVG